MKTKEQDASHLDMDARSEEATNQVIQAIFPADEVEDVDDGDTDTGESIKDEEKQETGEEEAGQETSEEKSKSGEEPEKSEEAESKEGRTGQEEQSLEKLEFIKDTVSELLPDKQLSFESEDDYKTAVNSLADEYKNQKELAEKEVGANEEMVKLFDNHPELVSVVRHLRENNSDFYEALYSVVDKDKVVPDKKTDPEGYAKYVLNREREKQAEDALNEKIKENSQASQKVIDKFKEDRGYGDDSFNELMDYGHNMLKNLTEFKVTERFLSAMEKAKNYEKDLAEAKKQGEVETKNETAKKRRTQKAGDSLPKMAGTGKSKKSEKSQSADPFVAALNDMADDEFGW